MADVPPRMLTLSEAADYLGIHPTSMKRIPPGEIAVYRVSSRGDRRYHREDLDAYLAARRVPSQVKP